MLVYCTLKVFPLWKCKKEHLRSVVTLAQNHEHTHIILSKIILAGLYDLLSFAPRSIAQMGMWPGYSPCF